MCTMPMCLGEVCRRPESGERWVHRTFTFFGSDQGGRTAAIQTSLITTCKRLDIDPFAYLRDVFERISAHPASRLSELLPDLWKTA